MNLRLLRAVGMSSVAALALCATASAYTLSIGSDGANVAGAPNIDTLGDTQFASEITPSTAVPSAGNNVVFRVIPNSNGSFPSGNTILTINLTNGTFTSAITNAVVDQVNSCGVGFSAAISTGGASGSSSVTLVLSDANTCLTTDSINISLPVKVTTNGTSATLTTTYVTDGNNQIEGGAPTGGPLTWATFAPAFSFVSAPNQPTQTATIQPLPAYSTFSGATSVSISNSVTGSVNPANHLADLSVPTAALATGSNILIAGSTAGYDTIGGIDFVGSYAALTGLNVIGGAFTTPAPIGATETAALFDNTSHVWNFDSNGLGGIATSSYNGTVTVTFNPTANLSQQQYSLPSGTLSNVARDGWSGMVTWLTDDTTSNAEVIRIVATVATSGPVRGTIMTRSSTGAGVTGATVELAPILAAGQELVINKAKLLSLFGPGYAGTAKAADLFITAESQNTGIIAQRLVLVPGGGLTWIPIVNCTGNSTAGPTTTGVTPNPAGSC